MKFGRKIIDENYEVQICFLLKKIKNFYFDIIILVFGLIIIIIKNFIFSIKINLREIF